MLLNLLEHDWMEAFQLESSISSIHFHDHHWSDSSEALDTQSMSEIKNIKTYKSSSIKKKKKGLLTISDVFW